MAGSILGNRDRGCLYPASQGKSLSGKVALAWLPLPHGEGLPFTR